MRISTSAVKSVAVHHHESVDGTGYPGNLSGDEIPYSARIIAVADAFDAMTSSRPYRNAMSREKAEYILRNNRGVQWDSDVIDAYFRCCNELKELCETAKDELQRNIASVRVNSDFKTTFDRTPPQPFHPQQIS